MARVGLLIEVNHSETGFTQSAQDQRKIENLKQVLHDPERGRFTEVNTLENPDPFALQEAVEALAVGRAKDDLLLLYFSGQALQDERGKLYLSTCLTRVNTQGRLVKSTAIPANFIDDVLSDCYSKQQVIILDCWRLPPERGFVDIGQQLCSEGRVVLTAFTVSQDCLQQEAQRSPYTHQLVEGLMTGAADLNGDSVISIGELYEYTRKKVQGVTPAVSLKMYQGPGDKTKIVLAKACAENSKLFDRDKVGRFARAGRISRVQRYYKSSLRNNAESQLKENQQLDLLDPNLVSTAQLKPASGSARPVDLHQGQATSLDADASKSVRPYHSLLFVGKTTTSVPAKTVTETNNTRSYSVLASRKPWLLTGAVVVTGLALIGITYGRWRQADQLQTPETFAETFAKQRSQCLPPAISQEAPNSVSTKSREQCESKVDWQDVQVQTLSGHADTVWSIAISPNGQTLASGSSDQTIKLWNLQTRGLLRTLPGHANTVWSVVISPDGQTLASGSSDQAIKLWNLQTGELLRTFSGHTDAVRSVAISPDGQTLASGSSDQAIKLWNLQTGELLRTFSGHTDAVRSVAISPDGQTLASGSSDQTIKLWNLQTGELLRTFSGHRDRVISIAISPDGQTLVSGSVDRTTKIWSLPRGKLLHTLSGDPNWFNSVALSSRFTKAASSTGSNPEILATGSGELKLWNLYSGELLTTLSHHSSDLTSVSFSSNGRILASGSQDKTIKIWRW